jgi:hypothetical protein
MRRSGRDSTVDHSRGPLRSNTHSTRLDTLAVTGNSPGSSSGAHSTNRSQDRTNPPGNSRSLEPWGHRGTGTDLRRSTSRMDTHHNRPWYTPGSSPEHSKFRSQDQSKTKRSPISALREPRQAPIRLLWVNIQSDLKTIDQVSLATVQALDYLRRPARRRRGAQRFWTCAPSRPGCRLAQQRGRSKDPGANEHELQNSSSGKRTGD